VRRSKAAGEEIFPLSFPGLFAICSFITTPLAQQHRSFKLILRTNHLQVLLIQSSFAMFSEISPIQVVRGFVWLVLFGVAVFVLVLVTAVRERLSNIGNDVAAEAEAEDDAVFEEFIRLGDG